MKATTIVKINPIVEMTSPILLQCKSGECGVCPNNTGKLLWVPNLWTLSEYSTFNFQYNFFDKSTENDNPVAINIVESDTPFGNKPTKQYATDTNIGYYSLAPSEMRLRDFLQLSFTVNSSYTVGFWLFFRQPNPAIGNVHDALCFEYNHEKKLITFRSF